MPPASYFDLLTIKKSAGLRTFSFGFTLQTLMSLALVPEQKPGVSSQDENPQNPTNKSRRLRVKNSQCLLPAFTETIADISDVRAE